MNCPKCGAIMREDAHFCNQCGARLEGHEHVPKVEAPRSRLMSRIQELKWIIMIYVIMSLCCMSSAFFLGFRTNWILWKLGLR